MQAYQIVTLYYLMKRVNLLIVGLHAFFPL